MSKLFLQTSRKILDIIRSEGNFNKVLKTLSVTKATKDIVCYEWDVDESQINRSDNIHGGCLASIFDVTTYVTFLTVNLQESNDVVLKSRQVGVITNLHMQYLKGVPLGDKITLDMTCVDSDNNISVIEGVFKNQNNQTIALAVNKMYIQPDAGLRDISP